MAGTFYQRDGRITSSATDTPAMTDPTPTPTRAEVEALIERVDPRSPNAPYGLLRTQAANALRTLAAENQSLRERAETAERERDGAIQWRNHYRQSWLDCRDTLTAALRAEADAWNDAIEAAAGVAEQYRDCWPRATAPDAQYELKQEYLHMAYGAKIVGEQVRALRRAAPTEGEA